MDQFRLIAALVAAISILCSGCGEGDFNYGKVGKIIEAAPMKLDAEYVMLTGDQLNCGIQEDLWEAPVASGNRSVARLKDKGRDLKFSDDVSVGELRNPFVQIRGDIPLVALEISNDHDGPEANTKLVEGRIGANIQNTCFQSALPIMGVRKGNFTQDHPPVLLFRYNNGWQLEGFQH
jgi:hypothetical protein